MSIERNSRRNPCCRHALMMIMMYFNRFYFVKQILYFYCQRFSCWGKIIRQTAFLSFDMATTGGEGKLWIQTSFTPLEIDLVLHSTCSGGVKKHTYEHRFGLGKVSLCNGISTFAGYLIPKPSFLKNSCDVI